MRSLDTFRSFAWRTAVVLLAFAHETNAMEILRLTGPKLPTLR
jgi:hypothetical protein